MSQISMGPAVILAGGRGTRIHRLAPHLPKPMLPILGKPVLQYQIECLRRSDVKDVLLVIGHLGERIREHFGDGSRFGVRMDYFVEDTPLGTGGCFGELAARLPETFFVLYGDVLLDMDFARMWQFHRSHVGCCTLFVHPNDHPADSNLVDVGRDGVVQGISRKGQPRSGWYRNCVNAGVFVFDQSLVRGLPGGMLDLERGVIAPKIQQRLVYGYRSTEYAKDMGTPHRYELVTRHVASGVVAARSLRNKQKAVFLDRDGTINHHVGLVSTPDQIQVQEEVFEALARLNGSEYLSILVTNQPVVARNLCSIDELEEIHRKLETVLGERNVYLDDLYYCPHHPDRGYPEENIAYKITCECRKPRIGLVEQAARQYNIDLSESYFVGDTTVDVQTGRNAGTRTILLSTGEGGRDAKYDVLPDFKAADLLDATEIVLS